ncbi:MAG: hypothetical protein P1U46_03880 [Patescibacteria group bacterium]|nr:hypothetical protein [Patescibacteria group bacterium]
MMIGDFDFLFFLKSSIISNQLQSLREISIIYTSHLTFFIDL